MSVHISSGKGEATHGLMHTDLVACPSLEERARENPEVTILMTPLDIGGAHIQYLQRLSWSHRVNQQRQF